MDYRALLKRYMEVTGRHHVDFIREGYEEVEFGRVILLPEDETELRKIERELFDEDDERQRLHQENE